MPPEPHPRRSRSFAVALGLVLALILGESGARWRHHHPPLPPKGSEAAPLGMFEPSEAMGVELAPSFSYPVERWTTNSLGLRDRDRRGEARAPLRVAMLGDSFTAGVGVDDTHHDSALVEEALDGVEVWNLGTPHYGLEQSWRRLEQFWPTVEPDVVILQAFPGNDPWDDGRGPAFLVMVNGEITRAGWAPSGSPFDGLRADIQRPLFAHHLPGDGPLWRHSSLYRATLGALSAVMERRADHYPWGMAPFDYEAFGAVAWLYLDPPPPPVVSAWAVSAAALGRIKTLVEGHGARLLVVSVPARIEVDEGDLREGLAMGWEPRPGARGDHVIGPRRFNPELAQDTFTAIVREAGLPLLDLRPAFREAAQRERMHYEDDSHWTAGGHREAARAIGRFLERQGLVRPPADFDARLDRAVPEGAFEVRFEGGFRPEEHRFDREEGDRKEGERRDEDRRGDRRQGDDRRGDGRQGDDRRGDRRQGDDRRGDRRQGDDRRGDGRQGEDRRGDGREGDDRRGDRRRADRAGPGPKEASEIPPRLSDPQGLLPLLPPALAGWTRTSPVASVAPLPFPRDDVLVAQASATYTDPGGRPHEVLALDGAGQPEIDQWFRDLGPRAILPTVPPGILPTAARVGVVLPEGAPELALGIDRAALQEREARLAPTGALDPTITIDARGGPPPEALDHLGPPDGLLASLPPAPEGWQVLDTMPMYRPHEPPDLLDLPRAMEDLFDASHDLWGHDGQPWTAQIKRWYRGPAGSFALVVQDTGHNEPLLRSRQRRMVAVWGDDPGATKPAGGRASEHRLRRWEGAGMRGFRACRVEQGLCKVVVPLIDPTDPKAPLARYNAILMGPPGADDRAYEALIRPIDRGALP